MILFNPSDDELKVLIGKRVAETVKNLGEHIDGVFSVSGAMHPDNNGAFKSHETFKGSGIWTFFDDPVQSAVHCVFEEQERATTQPD